MHPIAASGLAADSIDDSTIKCKGIFEEEKSEKCLVLVDYGLLTPTKTSHEENDLILNLFCVVFMREQVYISLTKF